MSILLPTRRRSGRRPCVLLALVCLLSTSAYAAASEATDPAAGGALMLRGKGVATQTPAVRLGTAITVAPNRQ